MTGMLAMLHIFINFDQVLAIRRNIDLVNFLLINFLQMLSKRFTQVVGSVQMTNCVFELIKTGLVTLEFVTDELWIKKSSL